MSPDQQHVADVAEIRAHFADQLAHADLHHSPFPYLVLPEALPPALYEQVLAENPFQSDPGRSFGDRPWMSRLRYRHHFDKRFDIDLSAGAAPAPPWDAISRAFTEGPWLYEVLVERFPAYFSLRFGDAVTVPGFWDRLEREIFLQRHEPGFEMDAHTDIPTRVASLIFSFADREGFDHCGTQLLAPNDPWQRCWGNDHHDKAGFRVVEVAPYRPNHCLVFFKTRHSFHAVAPEAGTAPNGRFGMQVQVFEGGRGALVDLSTPDLLANRQHTPRPIDRLVHRGRRVGGKVKRLVRRSGAPAR